MTEIPQLAGLPRRIFRSMRPVAPGAVFPGPQPLIDRMFAAKNAANHPFFKPAGTPRAARRREPAMMTLKTVKSVQLPDNANIGILGISLL